MSNTLNVALVEFMVPGQTGILCGYVASDEFHETFYRVAPTWDKFKKEYPDRESVLVAVLNGPGFSDISVSYSIKDGYPVIDEQDDDDDGSQMISHISFEGDVAIYG